VAIPSSITLKPYLKPRRNASQRQGKDIATKELLLHSSDHQKLDYTAREEEAGGLDALLKHYVGVYNPKTGKLEVMESRKLVVRGSVRSQQVTVEEKASMVRLSSALITLHMLIVFAEYERASKRPWTDLRHEKG
jgi:DNA-directed RNA polymerase I subunit RPA49